MKLWSWWKKRSQNFRMRTAPFRVTSTSAAERVTPCDWYAVGLDKLVNTSGDSSLCFRPLEPKLEVNLYIVWKKFQVFSRAAERFLAVLQEPQNFTGSGEI